MASLFQHGFSTWLTRTSQCVGPRDLDFFHGSWLHTQQALQEAQVDDAALEISEWQFTSNGHQNSILKIC